jgi:hypothetical protein
MTSAVAQQLLATGGSPWQGVPGYANVQSNLAVTALAQQNQAKQQYQAELANAAIGQHGALARQKNASDASIKVQGTYKQRRQLTLADKLSAIGALSSAGGASGGSVAQRKLGAAMIDDVQVGRDAPVTRFAGSLRNFQGLVNDSQAYQAAAEGYGLNYLSTLGKNFQFLPLPPETSGGSPTPLAQVQSPVPAVVPVGTVAADTPPPQKGTPIAAPRTQATSPTMDLFSWRQGLFPGQ